MALSANCLFKFGNFEFPSELIAEGGYDVKPNQRQDLDPFTDQTGLTHRNSLSHTKTEITITTRNNLSWNEVRTIMTGLTSNYINRAERDANCEYFDPEFFEVKSGHLYLDPSQSFKINIYKERYESIKFTFVEY